MGKLTLVLLFGTTVLLPGLLRAQEKWGLRKCVEYAMANNISVRQADIDARTSQLTYQQSKAAQYGQLSFNTGLGMSFGYSVDPATNLFIATDFLYQSYTLQGGANLFNWFSQRRQIESNRYSYLAQKTNVDKVRNDVALNVAAAYLTALAARQVSASRGSAAAESTAGQAHSRRSRNRCRADPTATSWSARRAPRCRKRHQCPSIT